MGILAIGVAGVALCLALAVIGLVVRKRRAGKAARDETGKAVGSQPHEHQIIVNRVFAVIDNERQQLGLPRLMRTSILVDNALKLLLESDRAADFDDLNADFSRLLQRADYPSLFPNDLSLFPRALLWQESWDLDTTIDKVAARVADGVLAAARENRRNPDTEPLYWPNSVGALLDEAAQDIGMALANSIPDPLPGIQIMLGVGAADYSSAVITRINKARVSTGVAPLELDSSLREIVRNYLAMKEVPAPGQLGRDLTRFSYTDGGGEIRGAASHGGVNPMQIPYLADTERVSSEDIVAALTAGLLEDYGNSLLNSDFQDIGVAIAVGRGPGEGLELADGYWARAEFVVGYRFPGNQSA